MNTPRSRETEVGGGGAAPAVPGSLWVFWSHWESSPSRPLPPRNSQAPCRLPTTPARSSWAKAAWIGPTAQRRKRSLREEPAPSPSPTQHPSGRGLNPGTHRSQPRGDWQRDREEPPPLPAHSCPLPTKQELGTGSDLLSFTFRAGAWLTALHRVPATQVRGQMKTQGRRHRQAEDTGCAQAR